ncbi:hypothetical protein [Candidatus Laterigemmans baculatus]|uniref:hypothetical protein n=1 Tax=Candidatus Laterigemmans baculatus TaxID=2770505 RepID=UPI0013D98951|nr:hypothetical protein [Candidatus Laterigemmans baculatus]
MAEFQSVEFLAVDAPLDDAALAFMRNQSTRAEIDRWRFTNVYHFGNFGGDVLAMMRRGYDIHVHDTNFGLRRVCFRIPDGFAFRDKLEPYLLDYEISWVPDDEGTGGVLTLNPEGEPDTYDWMEENEMSASDLIPLREMIIAGDFRPLYISHIAFQYDDEALEPPVPAGLSERHRALDLLGRFYEIDRDLIAIAAEVSPAINALPTEHAAIESWVQRQSVEELRSNLKDCLREPQRYPSKLLRKMRTETATPTAAESGSRTIGELRRRVKAIDDERERQRELAAAQEAERRKAEAERARQATLAEVANDPERVFARIDAAIGEKKRMAYRRVAKELSLIAQACGKPMARAKAEAIRIQYPGRSALIEELREAGF